MRKFFHYLVKTFKDRHKLLKMRQVPCSDEFFIKRLISKKKKEKIKKGKNEKRKGLIHFISSVYVLMNSFIFFFMVRETTRYTRY